jgi:hypothetical protein
VPIKEPHPLGELLKPCTSRTGTRGVDRVGDAGVAGVGDAGVAGVGDAGVAGVGDAGVAGVGDATLAGAGVESARTPATRIVSVRTTTAGLRRTP